MSSSSLLDLVSSGCLSLYNSASTAMYYFPSIYLTLKLNKRIQASHYIISALG
jgi:hypothetical protein